MFSQPIPRLPLLGQALAAAAGILLAHYLPLPSTVWLGTSLLGFGIWWLRRKTLWISWITLSLFASYSLLTSRETPGSCLAQALGKTSLLLSGEGMVIQPLYSYNRRSSTASTLESIVQTHQIENSSKKARFPRKAKIFLTLLLRHSAKEEISRGDVIAWTGRLRALPSTARRTPWLKNQGVYLQSTAWVFTRKNSPKKPPIFLRAQQRALQIRQRLCQGICRGIEKNPLLCTVISSLALGVEAKNPLMPWEVFRKTGTTHIFSVSGLHVGMVAALGWQVLRWVHFPRNGAICLLIPLLFAYSFVTGMRPPALRASCMAALCLASAAWNRRPLILNSLGVAALVVLIADPQQMLRAGFQLSFAVVSAIACLAPRLHSILSKKLLPDPFIPPRLYTGRERLRAAWARSIAGTFSVSTAAWIGSTPLLIGHFGSMSLSALLVNPLIVPLAFVVLGLASLGLVSDLVGLPGVAGIFNQANLLVASFILATASWAAEWPGGSVDFKEMR